MFSRLKTLTVALVALALAVPRSLSAQGASATGEKPFDGAVRTTPSPAFLDMRAWSVGTGLSVGMVGVELIRRLDIRHAIAVGAGIGGVGARTVFTPFERVGNIHDKLPYVSLEAMYAPWRLGDLDAPGAIGAGIGVQWWGGERSRFADVGIGIMTTRDGTLFGRQVVPTIRLATGRGRPY